VRQCGLGDYAPISTPRPFIPTIRTFELAIFFIAEVSLLWHRSKLTLMAEDVAGVSGWRKVETHSWRE
jgi:hypothetical protein